MKRPPKISAITPVRRSGCWVVQSVHASQERPPADCKALFVGNGSPEAPTPLPEDAHTKAWMRVVFRRHGVGSMARNAGLKATRDLFVGFLDADNHCLPHLPEGMVEDLEAEAGFVRFGCVRATFPEGHKPPFFGRMSTATTQINSSSLDLFQEASEWQRSRACRRFFRWRVVDPLCPLPWLNFAGNGDVVFRFFLHIQHSIQHVGVIYYCAGVPGLPVTRSFPSESSATVEKLLCQTFREPLREFARLRQVFFPGRGKALRKSLRILVRSRMRQANSWRWGRRRRYVSSRKANPPCTVCRHVGCRVCFPQECSVTGKADTAFLLSHMLRRSPSHALENRLLPALP